MSYDAARWLLRELGIAPKRAGRQFKLTPAQEQEVLDGLECEEAYNSIAERMGVSRKTVWRVKRRAAASTALAALTKSDITSHTGKQI